MRRDLSAEWQRCAREWHLLGNPERAAWCQALADYWASSLWSQLWNLGKAKEAMKALGYQ